MASESTYQRGLRAAVRGLWTGVLDFDQFWDAMSTTVRRGLNGAWFNAAGEYGILPGELNQEERAALQSSILQEQQHITPLGLAIEEGSKANGGKLGPLLDRVGLWAVKYQGVASQARVLAAKDEKLIWLRGATKDACNSCLRLAGKVKRASFWNRMGILPRVRNAFYLECKGFQ